MSDGLNKKFLNDPLSFLRSYFVRGAARKSGLIDVDFALQHKTSKYVTLLDRSKWGFSSNKVPCYYLKAQTDMVSGAHTALIPERIKYIFTDMISGCQFLVYGSSACPQFEHNNNLSGNGVDFSSRLERANRMKCLASLTPDIDYSRQSGSAENCAAIGIRQSSGRWQFFKQSINLAQQITLTQM